MGNAGIICHNASMISFLSYGLNATEVGNRLTLLRRALGMNQRQMAEFLGCTPSSVNMYEKGDPLFPIHHAAKLNYIHSIPLDWVYLGKPAMLPYGLGNKLAEMQQKQAAGQLEREPRIRRRLP